MYVWYFCNSSLCLYSLLCHPFHSHLSGLLLVFWVGDLVMTWIPEEGDVPWMHRVSHVKTRFIDMTSKCTIWSLFSDIVKIPYREYREPWHDTLIAILHRVEESPYMTTAQQLEYLRGGFVDRVEGDVRPFILKWATRFRPDGSRKEILDQFYEQLERRYDTPPAIVRALYNWNTVPPYGLFHGRPVTGPFTFASSGHTYLWYTNDVLRGIVHAGLDKTRRNSFLYDQIKVRKTYGIQGMSRFV